MEHLALTYDEARNLYPRSVDFKKAVKLLGGKTKWNGNKISAQVAKEAGVTFDMMVCVVSAAAKTDADIERRLWLWIADCAARVLHIYEKSESSDAPRYAIIATRQFACGKIDAAARYAAKAAARAAATAADKYAVRYAAMAAAMTASGDAAWDAARDAAGDNEAEWQFNRLVERLSENEPQDWPLPKKKGGDA